MYPKSRDINFKTGNLFPYVIGILGLLAAVYFQSRAFAFGFLFSTFTVYALSNKKSFKIIASSIFILSTALVLLVFFIKSDSSLGRVLIYKVSIQIFQDNFLLGIGLGNFQEVYLYQQANYFSKEIYTNKELLLADNTHYAFNDYWQFIIEIGIVGFVIVGVLFYLLGKLVLKSIRSKKHVWLTANVVSLLIAVLIAALFTHIFEQLQYQATVVLCITYLCLINIRKKWCNITILSISFLFLLAIGFKGMETYRINNNYNTALNLYIAGLKKECKIELQKITPIKDNKRAVLYLQILMSSYHLNYEKEILKLLAQYPNANTYKMLGDFYLFNGKIKAAENAYLTAINMVPNRFLPRQSLLRLYISQKKDTEAEKVANKIISLSIKIGSSQVNSIKQEAIDFLNKNL